jgi:protein-S-isoprenylcysteine O-methyltransferase Ste14
VTDAGVALMPLALAWAAYFALHSALASLAVKRRVATRRPQWMPWYRLAYNGIALALLLPLLAWTLAWPGPFVWEWRGAWRWLGDGLAILAALGFLWTLRDYDGAEFLGLRQARTGERRVEDQERLHLSVLHRFVRHPWYALGLVLLWTRDMDAARLVAATLASGYLLVGLRLEEGRLVALHGDVYRDYRRRVPALLPRPWRWLRRADAEALRRRARER